MWVTIYSRTQDLIENHFSQIAGGKISVLVIFRFNFRLISPFETAKYTSLVVTLTVKAQNRGFWFLFSSYWSMFGL